MKTHLFKICAISSVLGLSGCEELPISDVSLQASSGNLADGLNQSIKQGLRARGESAWSGHCLPAEANGDECTLIRIASRFTPCPHRAFASGHCRAVEIDAALLDNPVVQSSLSLASREFCSFSRSDPAGHTEQRNVVGCASPGENWRLNRPPTLLTICVRGITDGRVSEHFATRDGRRVSDVWCDRLPT